MIMLEITVFYEVTLCSLTDCYGHFGGTGCLPSSGRRVGRSWKKKSSTNVVRENQKIVITMAVPNLMLITFIVVIISQSFSHHHSQQYLTMF
jgi:hypothetical protein